MSVTFIKREHVKITVTPEYEECPIRGSFDSGDAEADEALAVALETRLENGDIWAWCQVAVKVDFFLPSGDLLLTSTHYLGCCSYDSESDFRNQEWTINGEVCKESGYFHDLVDEGLAVLNASLIDVLTLAGIFGRRVTVATNLLNACACLENRG